MQRSTQRVNETDWFFLSSGPEGRLILLAEMLASNESALCRISILAFSFVLITN